MCVDKGESEIYIYIYIYHASKPILNTNFITVSKQNTSDENTML